MSRKIKNVIFDWSGTLSDDLRCIYDTSMAIFRRLGIEPISFERYKGECTTPYMNFYKHYTDASKEELDRLYLEEIEKVEDPKLYPHVKEILETLRAKGIHVAILSSQVQSKIDKGIKSNGLEGHFAEVIGGVHDKTQVLEGLVRDLGFRNEEIAYVGDMVHDIEAGKSANVVTIAVGWGYHTEEKLMRANPDHLISDISQLEGMVS